MPKTVKWQVSDAMRLKELEIIDGIRLDREAARAEATRELFEAHYIRGDLHMHTVYSDGYGTVGDMVRVGRARGLDFLFITDHDTVRQKVECAVEEGIWWSQEPNAGPHHVCILAGERKFTPTGDMRRDAERLRKLGVFFFYPHPVGYYHDVWYSQEQKDALAQVGPEFAIEVMNGIFRGVAFHDEWTEANVSLWDRYLCKGFRVTGLAASDSHLARGVGNVWTGVLGADRTLESVLGALQAGRVFASSGPAVNLTCGDTPMGGTNKADRPDVRLRIECADSYGLAWARMVQDGTVVREYACRGARRLCEEIEIIAPPVGGYVRAECAALDDRRAYSNPIYFAP